MNLASVIVKRVAWVLPVAFGVVTLTFLAARVFGGDPIEQYVPPDATDQLREAIAAQLGLDRPLWEQYTTYLAGLLHGDLGESMSSGRPVAEDIGRRFPATIELGATGLFAGVIIGIVLGVTAAVRRDTWLDFTLRGVTIGGMALPSFLTSLGLIAVFAVTFRVLPGPVGRLPIGAEPPPFSTGFYTVDSIFAGQWDTLGLSLVHLILPATAIAIGVMAPIARVTRNAMTEALDSDYIRTARAMGHGQMRIWYDYALRNALLPTITMFGEALAFTLGGVVLVESVFGWPGLGQYALQVTNAADFSALQGFVLYSALLAVVAYLVVDVLYMVVDPRIRHGART